MPELTLCRFHSKVLLFVRSGLRTEVAELKFFNLGGQLRMSFGSFSTRTLKSVAKLAIALRN